MAHKGIGFFDRRGQYFKNPEDASISDLSALLGKIGDGDSLAPGIAHLLIERRADIEQIFAELDQMKAEEAEAIDYTVAESRNVTKITGKLSTSGK